MNSWPCSSMIKRACMAVNIQNTEDNISNILSEHFCDGIGDYIITLSIETLTAVDVVLIFGLPAVMPCLIDCDRKKHVGE